LAIGIALGAKVVAVGVEDRATLESDPSATAGECTDGWGACALPFLPVRYSIKR